MPKLTRKIITRSFPLVHELEIIPPAAEENFTITRQHPSGISITLEFSCRSTQENVQVGLEETD